MNECKRLSDCPADRLAQCRGEAVPPAGDVEVLAWATNGPDPVFPAKVIHHLWDTKEQAEKHLKGINFAAGWKVGELVDRAHVTHLTCEVGRLNAQLCARAGQIGTLAGERDGQLAVNGELRLELQQAEMVSDALQSELTKARESSPVNWTDRQVLDFLGVALRNVDLVGEVRLSEIRQGFQFMQERQTATPIAQSDENALEIFSKLMAHKLAKKSAEGRSGWQQCSQADLSRMLREHVEKGDPVDVANFCMMLKANGFGIAKAVPPSGDVEVLAVVTLGSFSAEELGDIDIEPRMVALESLQQEIVKNQDVCIELVDRAHVTRLTAERDWLKLKLKLSEQDKQTFIKANETLGNVAFENQMLNAELIKSREFFGDAEILLSAIRDEANLLRETRIHSGHVIVLDRIASKADECSALLLAHQSTPTTPIAHNVDESCGQDAEAAKGGA